MREQPNDGRPTFYMYAVFFCRRATKEMLHDGHDKTQRCTRAEVALQLHLAPRGCTTSRQAGR